jgi:hypothetical protein
MDDILDKPPKRSLLPVIGVLVAFVVLLGAVGYYYWASQNSGQTSAPPVQNLSGENTSSTPPVQTSSSTVQTSTDRKDNYLLGDTLRLFKGDEVWVAAKNDPTSPFFQVTALDFTDSRCPEGAQCIWAGERSVALHLVWNGPYTDAADVSLKEKTSLTTEFNFVKLTLIAIDDEKGGTYADIKVE